MREAFVVASSQNGTSIDSRQAGAPTKLGHAVLGAFAAGATLAERDLVRFLLKEMTQ